jgi:hypothetical protein
MKTTLSFLFLLCCVTFGFAQTPEIQGDLLLCPNTNGTATITNDIGYDSYTWYYKYWFLSDDYVAIEGQDGPSFTYDWYTYDQALIKVVVTLNGDTFESNAIQIDSYAWTSMTTGFENTDNVTIDNNGNLLLCEGTAFTVQVFDPYSANIQWYKDGEAIEGANSQNLEIDAEGTYYVVAAPPFCPDSSSSSEGLPFVISMNADCQLSVQNPNSIEVSLLPNPAKDFLAINARQAVDMVNIYTTTGQLVVSQKIGSTTGKVAIAGLASGVYIAEVTANGASRKIKIVKE